LRKSPREAADAIRSVPEGEDMIVTCQAYIDSGPKASKDALIGIILKSYSQQEGIFIKKIKEASLFSGGPLRPGMQVLTINDVPCPDTVQESIELARSVEGTLTLVCADYHLEPPEAVKLQHSLHATLEQARGKWANTVALTKQHLQNNEGYWELCGGEYKSASPTPSESDFPGEDTREPVGTLIEI